MLVDLLKFVVTDAGAAELLMKEQTVASREDEGCLYAHVFRSKDDPAEIFMLMSWENQESVDKHMDTEHDILFRERLDPILAGPPEFLELVI